MDNNYLKAIGLHHNPDEDEHGSRMGKQLVGPENDLQKQFLYRVLGDRQVAQEAWTKVMQTVDQTDLSGSMGDTNDLHQRKLDVATSVLEKEYGLQGDDTRSAAIALLNMRM